MHAYLIIIITRNLQQTYNMQIHLNPIFPYMDHRAWIRIILKLLYHIEYASCELYEQKVLTWSIKHDQHRGIVGNKIIKSTVRQMHNIAGNITPFFFFWGRGGRSRTTLRHKENDNYYSTYPLIRTCI